MSGVSGCSRRLVGPAKNQDLKFSHHREREGNEQCRHRDSQFQKPVRQERSAQIVSNSGGDQRTESESAHVGSENDGEYLLGRSEVDRELSQPYRFI